MGSHISIRKGQTMARLLLALFFSSLLFADWGTRETGLLRVSIFPSPARIPAALSVFIPAVPPGAVSQPVGFHIVVQPRLGTTYNECDEYQVVVRYQGLDGKTYTITRNLTPDDHGNAHILVKAEIDKPLSVTAEPVKRLPVEEAQ